jgi:hypothetical protein
MRFRLILGVVMTLVGALLVALSSGSAIACRSIREPAIISCDNTGIAASLAIGLLIVMGAVYLMLKKPNRATTFSRLKILSIGR